MAGIRISTPCSAIRGAQAVNAESTSISAPKKVRLSRADEDREGARFRTTDSFSTSCCCATMDAAAELPGEHNLAKPARSHSCFYALLHANDIAEHKFQPQECARTGARHKTATTARYGRIRTAT